MARRLMIVVEGQTKLKFVSEVLMPHFQSLGISVSYPKNLEGNVSIQRLAAFLKPLISSFDHVTTLVDYYAFKNTDHDQWNNADELEALITERIAKQLKNPHKFTPYVQQYEFEALVFSEPEKIINVFHQKEQNALLKQFDEINRQYDNNPENINQGRETCPSARLKNMFTEYDKVEHGIKIAKQIGLERIRERCPRFDNWLKKLETLGETSCS